MRTDRPAIQLCTKARQIILLPIGSCEQHGPYLPVDTDLRISQLLTDKLDESLSEYETLILPAIPFSSSWEHKGTGTIALSINTLGFILHDIAKSITSWKTPVLLVLINWHGGNSVLYSLATEITATENIPTTTIGAILVATQIWQELSDITTVDIHAGALETSIVGAYWPHLLSGIDISSKHDYPDIKAVQVQTAMQALGIHRITADGIWGNPEDANILKGQKTIDLTVNKIKKEIEDLLILINDIKEKD